MNLKTVVSEVGCWPVEERLQLLEEIWEGLGNQGHAPELTEDLKALLDRRLAALEANPGGVITWDEINDYVRRPR